MHPMRARTALASVDPFGPAPDPREEKDIARERETRHEISQAGGPEVWPILEAGRVVQATDRGNFGRIEEDLGPAARYAGGAALRSPD